MSSNLVRRTLAQPLSSQAMDPSTDGSGPMLGLNKVQNRLKSFTMQPYIWTFLGGVLAFLGCMFAEGSRLQKTQSSGAEVLSDPGGLFAEITGPFDDDPSHTEFVRCLRNRATFHVQFSQGSCTTLLQLQHEFATSLEWDHSLCKRFVPDPLESVFLEPARIRYRNGTTDGLTIKDVFCAEDSRYLALLARHLPTDRPLTALDAGAHIGMNTLMLTRYAKFHARIIALTMNRDDMQLLRVNTDNMTHIVTRKHGILVPDALAQKTDFLSESSSLRSYLGWADHQRFKRLRQQTDGFVWYEGSIPPGAGEIPEGDLLPAFSLRQLREFMPTRRFDIVLLDMYGVGAQILRDPASRQVLCQATCLVISVRTQAAASAGLPWALQEFMASCPASHRLVYVGPSGKSDVLCQEQSAKAVRERSAAASEAKQSSRDKG